MKFESFDIYCEMLYRNNRAHKKNFNQRFLKKKLSNSFLEASFTTTIDS